jgi:hypothetical protein
MPAQPHLNSAFMNTGLSRRFLERRPQLTLSQVDPLIRQLTLYRDLINTKIQEQDHECD